YVGTNERYDPSTDKWVTLASMPTPRTGFAITACGGKIYCIGGYGYDESGLIPKTSRDLNEVYDIASDSWSVKTPLPVSEYFIQAHVMDGKIWVVTQQTLYVYDTVEDSWTSKSNIPTQGIHAFSTVVDNKIIIIDKVAHDSYLEYNSVVFIATMKVMIYNPKTDVWSKGQTSPEHHIPNEIMIRSITAGVTTGEYAPKKIYTLLETSSYAYDLVEDIWSTITGPEHTSLTGYGVAVVDDLLYVFGGIHYPHVENLQYVPIGHKNAIPAPESSNPTTDFWSIKASMRQARHGLGVVAVDGKIYAIGGSILPDVANGSLVGTNEQYNPQTDEWVTLKSMSTPRAYFAIAAYDGKIYCIGGAVGFNIEGWLLYSPACDVNEVYDTATDSWSTMASPPFNGTHMQTHVVDGKIFVLHGKDLYMYNPKTDVWTNKTGMSMPPREGFNPLTTSVVVDDKIFVIGEFEPEKNQFEQKILSYNPKTDVWNEERQENLPSVVGKAVAVVTTGVYAPQKIYVIGFTSGVYMSIVSNQVYDPLSYTWSVAKDMPSDRQDFGVAVVDDILYVIGGSISTRDTPSRVLAVNEQYVPIGYNYTPPSTSSTPPTSLITFEPESPSFNIPIAAILAITIVTIATVLFFHFRKRTKY
ncbi:MAG: hypothetical protein FWC33_04420, partial [Candidatus Bathyarchaeota archaeon]|nr:hypothetical protein [Candidatus Termiticorpusculum sp.]